MIDTTIKPTLMILPKKQNGKWSNYSAFPNTVTYAISTHATIHATLIAFYNPIAVRT